MHNRCCTNIIKQNVHNNIRTNLDGRLVNIYQVEPGIIVSSRVYSSVQNVVALFVHDFIVKQNGAS